MGLGMIDQGASQSIPNRLAHSWNLKLFAVVAVLKAVVDAGQKGPLIFSLLKMIDYSKRSQRLLLQSPP